MIIYGDGANDNRHLPSTEASLDELLMGEGGRADEASLCYYCYHCCYFYCADEASLSKLFLESEIEKEMIQK